jgi:DNA-binding Lrp family transcriptional regulator
LCNLTEAEEAALQPASADVRYRPDDGDARILDLLTRDARLPARRIAAQLDVPESTVRRRIRLLSRSGTLRTQVLVDPRRLGLHVDANLYLRVPPSRLHHVGHSLARLPAVHGAVATSGSTNLQVAVWLPDLDALYRFLTEEIGRYSEIHTVETVLVGRSIERGSYPAHGAR